MQKYFHIFIHFGVLYLYKINRITRYNVVYHIWKIFFYIYVIYVYIYRDIFCTLYIRKALQICFDVIYVRFHVHITLLFT